MYNFGRFNKMTTNPLIFGSEKESQKSVITSFKKKMIKMKIPFYTIGYVQKYFGTKLFIEVVVKRPEKYNSPKLISKIPKEYKTYKVVVV